MPGICERRGGVHSGGRYAQMCTFSRPLACEYQVLSGSPARMLKKRQVLTGFFFTGLAQSRAHQRRSVSGTVRGNCVRVCVRRAFSVRSGGGVCVLLCVSTSTFVIILRRSLCFPVIKRCSSRQNVGRCVLVGRCAAHGFITASSLLCN